MTARKTELAPALQARLGLPESRFKGQHPKQSSELTKEQLSRALELSRCEPRFSHICVRLCFGLEDTPGAAGGKEESREYSLL